jgi:hypothetical protein
MAERFWAKVDKLGEKDCWEWKASRDELGYGFFRAKSGKSMVKAHRWCWIITNGDPGSLHVLHRCDNPPCVNPNHLFLGDHQDNMQDRNEKGRTTRGRPVAHGNASGARKVDLEQVREIRRRYAAGGSTQASLGTEFGISQTEVGRIVRRDRWLYDE